MARRKRSKARQKRRPSVSQIVLYVLSVIIVLSMVIGFVVSVLPTPTVQESVDTPTPIIFTTITPTHTPELTATLTPATEGPPADGEATSQPDQ